MSEQIEAYEFELRGLLEKAAVCTHSQQQYEILNKQLAQKVSLMQEFLVHADKFLQSI